MIPNQWYVVLESKEVPPGRPVGVTRMGEKLVFWRDQAGQVHCLRDLCPHRGVALSAGKVTGDCLECPFHAFQFDPAGRCTLVPANGRASEPPKALRAGHYPAAEGHGFIYLFWGEAQGELPAPPWFEDIDESFLYGSARDPWKIHYSRVIENQLDAAHVPFVHYNTIGRGGGTVVDGPLVEWTAPDRFRVYVFNRQDDGRLPRKPHELARPDVPFHLEFIFPNLWQNHISPDVRVVVAFTPVDDEHTIMYLRFYQKFMTAPVLGRLVAGLAMPFNIYIAHQDRRVVETQRPARSFLRMGEKLVQSDGPIIAYRKKRQELIDCISTAAAENQVHIPY